MGSVDTGAAAATVTVGGRPLTLDEVVDVARRGAPVRIDPASSEAMRAARAAVDELASGARAVYGVSTGFGALASMNIGVGEREALQLALVRSHAAGSGPEVEDEVVRALMLLRMQTFTTARTGVRFEIAERYVAMLNHGLTPTVHEYGSLGCSGDLAPLAHCALAALGEGTVRTRDGRVLESSRALAEVGLEPLRPAAKEGLALINGTDGMLGMLSLAIADLRSLFRHADIATAMSVEALLGTDRVFAPELHAVRPHPGQRDSAANLAALLAGSAIMDSHRGEECTVVQDAYSLRCAPQVAGAARATLAHAVSVADIELGSAVDNPVVLDDGRVESNGNFHGAPVGYVLDFLAIAVADMASMSERRTDRLLDPGRSHGLPAFLAGSPGIDSGLMIAQYTQAAIVSELKRLAAPASVDSIPSSAMQEDHVSMGWSAGRKLLKAVDGLTRVVAIETMTAARALEMRHPLTPSPATARVLAALRETVRGVGPDRWLSPDIDAAVDLVRAGALLRAAESVVGALR
ncbi:histidine ammonia-lyase [Pseudonocardia nematodicida]|uniref:Histidine ammonia-lyase n=1 Tax=Pseudonocardia nematodicida TaxID=1206997 RepID=A0ABV1K8Y8_9PSEU